MKQSTRPNKVNVLDERDVYRDFFRIVKAKLQFERFDGSMTSEVSRLNFVRGHSAAILLHDPLSDEFIFVEQFRYPAYTADSTDGWLLEIIAGVVEEGESPREVARREALEETGYKCRNVRLLHEFYPTPGGSSERISVFFGLAGKKAAAGGGLASENEDIRVVRRSVAQTYRDLERGRLRDGKTIVALLAVKAELTNRKNQ